MRVFVYFNLHKKLWSVRALEGQDKGRVIARSPHVLLHDATGKVSEAGRQRVLRERKKNVHAGLVGTLVSLDPQALLEGSGSKITYNPYKYASFVHADTGTRFEGAGQVYLTPQGVTIS